MEMKFYEKLGVRQWKKFVLWLDAKTERNPTKRNGGNYYLNAINVKAAKNFKVALIFNGLIHSIGALFCIYCIMGCISNGDIISYPILIFTICFLINAYCVMLQRYNWLRIKRILKKSARN